MVPVLSLGQRIVAWILWKYERFDSEEDAEIAVERPEFLRCTSLLRDYYYSKKARVK